MGVDQKIRIGNDNNKEYEEIIIAKVKINIKELESWRKPNSDDIPICSFLSLYEACGLTEHIRKYHQDHPDFQVVPLDNIACNFYTLQELKNFIQSNWEQYSLIITEDNKISWDETKWKKGKKHYRKKLKAIVRNSINTDFANFCPAIDDELEDDILIFRIFKEKIIEVEVIEKDNNHNENSN